MKKKITAIALFVLVISGCTDSSTAEMALKGAGYTDIELTGYRFIGCGDDDDFSTGFSAKGPTGIPVTGVVCSSWFGKGATVRID